jgi:hypothetical protein
MTYRYIYAKWRGWNMEEQKKTFMTELANL